MKDNTNKIFCVESYHNLSMICTKEVMHKTEFKNDSILLFELV
jgi:hypothetical protein